MDVDLMRGSGINMSNNPNFHNNGGRPVYNHVFQDDELLGYAHEKARALVGYFATSPNAETIEIDPYGNGRVILGLNGKKVAIRVDEGLKRILIAEIDEGGYPVHSFYNYEFYLRHTIDHLIIEATKHILEIAGVEESYKLWILNREKLSNGDDKK